MDDDFLGLPKAETYVPPEVMIGAIRELREEELQVLKAGAQNMNILAVRTAHHAVARYMAAGMLDTEVAAMTGFAVGTISKLKGAPAFQDLLAYYMDKADKVAFELRAKLELLGSQAIDALNDRLAGEEPLPVDFLKDLTFGTLDRLGHGPTRNVRTVGTVLTADDLRKMKEAWKASPAGFIEATAEVLDEET